MRIWIDINTPKQVLFFKLFYEKLLLLKYEVLLTSRKYREVELISDNIGLPLHYIGKHGGHSLYGKLSSSNDRVVELTKLINDWSPVLSISFSSNSEILFFTGTSFLRVTNFLLTIALSLF